VYVSTAHTPSQLEVVPFVFVLFGRERGRCLFIHFVKEFWICVVQLHMRGVRGAGTLALMFQECTQFVPSTPFAVANTDDDGYVSGVKAVKYLQRAGLPQRSLARPLADNPARVLSQGRFSWCSSGRLCSCPCPISSFPLSVSARTRFWGGVASKQWRTER
jgi:hypothetical protein